VRTRNERGVRKVRPHKESDALSLLFLLVTHVNLSNVNRSLFNKIARAAKRIFSREVIARLLDAFFSEYPESFTSEKEKTSLQCISRCIYSRCHAKFLAILAFAFIHIAVAHLCFFFLSSRGTALSFISFYASRLERISDTPHVRSRSQGRPRAWPINEIHRIGHALKNPPRYSGQDARMLLAMTGRKYLIAVFEVIGPLCDPYIRPKMLALLSRNSFVSFRIIIR
jgi:hypothetical protein